MALHHLSRRHYDLVNDAASALSDAARVVVQGELGDGRATPDGLHQAALSVAVQALGRTDVEMIPANGGFSAPIRRVESNIMGIARGLGLAMGATATAGVQYQKDLAAAVMLAMSNAMIEASEETLKASRGSGH